MPPAVWTGVVAETLQTSAFRKHRGYPMAFTPSKDHRRREREQKKADKRRARKEAKAEKLAAEKAAAEVGDNSCQ